MLLIDLVTTSQAVAAESGRTAKTASLASALRAAGPGDVGLAVRFLSGELRQRRTGVGWAALRAAPAPAAEAELSLHDVDTAFELIAAVAGPGSAGRRRGLVIDLMSRATAGEQAFLAALVAGELRQGALESVLVDAVAEAAGRPLAELRRAVMLRGELAAVAEVAFTQGRSGLAAFRLEVGRPVRPMLAQPAGSLADALRAGPAGVEWKIDGVRVQVHRDGPDVSVFTRSLDDITDRVPEIVETALALPVRAAVLDGEAIALEPDGRPRRFQQTASRMASRADTGRLRTSLPLSTFVFDVLHLDGVDLLDAGAAERYSAAAEVLPAAVLVPRIVTEDVAVAGAFFDDALKRGHEGVIVKSLAAPYDAGRRGGGWLKVKPVHTLDLVVLAAEWGHGRRRGWLSNLHLGARDPAGGGFVMLGKTFKGLTDELLRWQTDALLTRAVGRDDWAVRVRPELVVEVACDGVQTSSRYPGGMALRFARVLRYRPDKRADEADTLDAVRLLYARG